MLRSLKLIRRFSAFEKPFQVLKLGDSQDFSEGVIHKLKIGDKEGNEVAIMRVNGVPYAVSNKCPHSGAPLHKGYLDRYTIICPSHHSRFDIRTGEVKTGPSPLSLKRFEVREGRGLVLAKIYDEDLESVAEPVEAWKYATYNPANKNHYMIIGGGPAALSTAETLRKVGFEGAITMLTKESYLPYDRTVLSKDFSFEPKALTLRPQSFYDKLGIEVKLNTEVTEVDPDYNEIITSSGKVYKYTKLCVATGGKPKVSIDQEIFMGKYKNLIGLRSMDDYFKFKNYIEPTEGVVIVGGSLLGMELAHALRVKYPSKTISVFDNYHTPLGRHFGPEISNAIVFASRKVGLNLRFGHPIDHFMTQDDKVFGVRFNRTAYYSGCVLLCTGAAPVSHFMPESLLNPDKTIKVDPFMHTIDNNVFAAGDVAKVFDPHTGVFQRCEHWTNAIEQGKAAALSMVGLGKLYSGINSYTLKAPIEASFVGHNYAADYFYTWYKWKNDDYNVPKFTILYRGFSAVGVASMNIPNAAAVFKIALERNLLPSSHAISGPPKNKIDFETIKARAMSSSLCSC
eukprot:CAMPEP_0204910834 /NCGR_PEP_ID=MMETSP1397-20131031/9278_1 /ASSEMBLY_ACC=CAM_ASM_000891 /TAXON_ID=49980 /ORGANISM="Climacostomum Climacostomum virens, Strain Stock W-24" /LENGTH=567 /DNA_ID=CAMNT_0052081143 /DNA_START=1436 /DNA_END=3136 /DNA_ORIENTATION=-